MLGCGRLGEGRLSTLEAEQSDRVCAEYRLWAQTASLGGRGEPAPTILDAGPQYSGLPSVHLRDLWEKGALVPHFFQLRQCPTQVPPPPHSLYLHVVGKDTATWSLSLGRHHIFLLTEGMLGVGTARFHRKIKDGAWSGHGGSQAPGTPGTLVVLTRGTLCSSAVNSEGRPPLRGKAVALLASALNVLLWAASGHKAPGVDNTPTAALANEAALPAYDHAQCPEDAPSARLCFPCTHPHATLTPPSRLGSTGSFNRAQRLSKPPVGFGVRPKLLTLGYPITHLCGAGCTQARSITGTGLAGKSPQGSRRAVPNRTFRPSAQRAHTPRRSGLSRTCRGTKRPPATPVRSVPGQEEGSGLRLVAPAASGRCLLVSCHTAQWLPQLLELCDPRQLPLENVGEGLGCADVTWP